MEPNRLAQGYFMAIQHPRRRLKRQPIDRDAMKRIDLGAKLAEQFRRASCQFLEIEQSAVSVHAIREHMIAQTRNELECRPVAQAYVIGDALDPVARCSARRTTRRDRNRLRR
jgi:hypothetical protein